MTTSRSDSAATEARAALFIVLWMVLGAAVVAIGLHSLAGSLEIPATVAAGDPCACPDPTMIVRDQHGPIYGYSTQGPDFVGAPAMCWVRPDGLAAFDSSGANPWRARRR